MGAGRQPHGGFGRWRFIELKDPYDCRLVLTALTFEPLVLV